MHTHTSEHTHAQIHTHKHTHIHTPTHTHTHTHAHIHIRTHIHTHAHTYTHAQTNTRTHTVAGRARLARCTGRHLQKSIATQFSLYDHDVYVCTYIYVYVYMIINRDGERESFEKVILYSNYSIQSLLYVNTYI